MRRIRLSERLHRAVPAVLRCAFCGGRLEPCLARLGAIACHDCRDEHDRLHTAA